MPDAITRAAAMACTNAARLLPIELANAVTMRNTKRQTGDHVRSGRGRDIVLLLVAFGLYLFATGAA